LALEDDAVQVDCSRKVKAQGEESYSLKVAAGSFASKLKMMESDEQISKAATRGKLRGRDEEVQSCQHSLEDFDSKLEMKEKELQYKEIEYKEHLASTNMEVQSPKEGLEKQLAIKTEELDYSQKEIQCYADKVDFLMNELQSFKYCESEYENKLMIASKELQSCKCDLEQSARDLGLTGAKLESCKAVEKDYLLLLDLKDKELESCKMRYQNLAGLCEQNSRELKSCKISVEEYTEKLKAKEEELLSTKLEVIRLSDHNDRGLPTAVNCCLPAVNKEIGTGKLKAEKCLCKLDKKEKEIQVYKLIAGDYANILEKTEKNLEMHKQEAEEYKSKYNHKSEDLEKYKLIVADYTKALDDSEKEVEKLKCQEAESFLNKAEDWTKERYYKDKQIELYKVKLDRCEESLKIYEKELEEYKPKVNDCAATTKGKCISKPENNSGDAKTMDKYTDSNPLLAEKQANKLNLKGKEVQIEGEINCASQLDGLTCEVALNSNRLEHKRKELEVKMEVQGSANNLVKNNEIEAYKEAVQSYSKQLELCNKDIESYKIAAEDYANELDSKDKQLQIQKNRADEYLKRIEEKDRLLQFYKRTANESTKQLALLSEELRICKRKMEEMESRYHGLEGSRGEEVRHGDEAELSYNSQIEYYAEEMDMKDRELQSYKFIIDKKLSEIKQNMDSCSVCYSNLKQQLRDKEEQEPGSLLLNNKKNQAQETNLTHCKTETAEPCCSGINSSKRSNFSTLSNNSFEAHKSESSTSNSTLITEIEKIKFKLLELMSLLKKWYISSGVHPDALKKTKEVIAQSLRVKGQEKQQKMLSISPNDRKNNSSRCVEEMTTVQMQTMFVSSFRVMCDMEIQLNTCCSLLNAACSSCKGTK